METFSIGKPEFFSSLRASSVAARLVKTPKARLSCAKAMFLSSRLKINNVAKILNLFVIIAFTTLFTFLSSKSSPWRRKLQISQANQTGEIYIQLTQPPFHLLETAAGT